MQFANELRQRLQGSTRILILALVMAFAICVPFLSVYLEWSVLFALPLLVVLMILIAFLD